MDVEEARDLLDDFEPTPALIETALHLMVNANPHVRDWATFTLGQQWSEIDNDRVRAALTARLDDNDLDARCEALFGLALRHDRRILPRVVAALTRADDSLWMLELLSAGALGDPSLHPLVARHQDCWDDNDMRMSERLRGTHAARPTQKPLTSQRGPRSLHRLSSRGVIHRVGVVGGTQRCRVVGYGYAHTATTHTGQRPERGSL